MHVAVDMTSLMAHRTGVETACLELVLSLSRCDRRNTYTLFVNREDVSEFRDVLPGSFKLQVCSTRNRAIRGLAQQSLLPAACLLQSIDVLHSPAFVAPLFRARASQLLTIHDMTFFTLPEVHSALHRSFAFKHAVKRSAHRADLIHVPSEATRTALLEYWPAIPEHRIRVMPWGVAPQFSPAKPEEVSANRRRLRLPDRFILFVGTIEPRKNVDTLIESYYRLVDRGRTDVHLVLVGRMGWNQQSVTAKLHTLERSGLAHYLGYVGEQDLYWIYRAAHLFVYPSRYEGFGFPPLEAMACGAPVVASRGSALENNLRDAAELTDAGDPETLLSALEKVLTESPEARSARIRIGLERARQFSWARTAEMMLECYRELSELASD